MSKKPTISPRKPPTAPSVDPTTAATFVAGGHPPPPVPAPPSASSRSTILTRQDGRQLKRTTVYLPTNVAKKLAVRCAELDMELSAAMTEAVEAWLEKVH